MNLRIVVIVLTACQISNSNLSPFGVKMCKSLCQQTQDCEEFGYSQVHLVCNLKDPSDGGEELLYNVSRKHLPVCPSQSRCVLGKSGHVICINDTPRMMILVMRVISMKKTAASLINPQTGLSSSYREIDFYLCCTIAYLSSIQKLVVISRTYLYLMELKSLTIMSSEYLMKVKGLHGYQGGLTVDDDQRLVFYTVMVARSHFCIHSIHAVTSYKHLVMKENIQNPIVDIAADPPRNRLFVCANQRIISVSYDGNNKRIINKDYSFSVSAISVSSNGHFLYVSDTFEFWKLSVDGQERIKLRKFKERIIKIVISDGKMFHVMFAISKFIQYRFEADRHKVPNTMESWEKIRRL